MPRLRSRQRHLPPPLRPLRQRLYLRHRSLVVALVRNLQRLLLGPWSCVRGSGVRTYAHAYACGAHQPGTFSRPRARSSSDCAYAA